jgi:alanine racemase
MRETRLEISRKRLQHNLDVFRSKISPKTKILANLKGNAYGIGAVITGKYLEQQGIDYFSVAYINEGILLRKNNIRTNLIVFNPSFEHFKPLVDYRLEPEVSSLAYLQKLSEFLQTAAVKKFPVHLKLDTGMHRAGIMASELDDLLRLLSACPQIQVKSVFSHLAAAEDPDEDVFTLAQIDLYKQMTRRIQENLSGKFFRHLLNTAGVFRFPEAQFDMIRPGLGIYGYNLIREARDELQPIARFVTRINQIKRLNEGDTVGYNRNFTAGKNTEVALLPVGYADGFNRLLGQGRYRVRCKNKEAAVVGNVSMDTISIDISGMNCKPGDEVILFDDKNDVYQMAEILQTIPYEIITSITRRVERVMV